MTRTRVAVALLFLLSGFLGPRAAASFRLEYAEGVEHGKGLRIPSEAPRGLPAASASDLGSAVSLANFQEPEPTPEIPFELPEPKHIEDMSVRERLIQAWPGDDDWMLRTVACESGFDAGATSPSGNHHGYFQMGGWAKANYGDPRGQTPEQQAAAAWQLLNDEGSSQWECSPWRYNP